MKIAALTMVYNEPDMLPLWLAYYGAQLGREHCYVVDHGSTDGSTEGLAGVTRMHVPRSGKDEVRRARFLSSMVASLLEYYEWVVVGDVDEIVVADPAYHDSLPEYVAQCGLQVVTAIGFNVLHMEEEADYDPAKPMLRQRGWMQFVGSMCKPVLTRRRLRWQAGFHMSDAEPRCDDLMLFHLRWADREIGARRLLRTRGLQYATEQESWWHRVSDEEGMQMFRNMAATPRDGTVAVEGGAAAVSRALWNTFGPVAVEPGGELRHSLNMHVPQLWRVPERFADSIPAAIVSE